LRGHFIEKKHLAFAETLLNDIEAGIFSFVSIDEEDGKKEALDRIRMVRKAAMDDRMFGMLFFSKPDFEFHNFTLPELEEVLWDIASENGADENERATLHDAIANTTSAKELLSAAKRAVSMLVAYDKSEDWGKRLIEYAIEHEIKLDGTSRPILVAAASAL